jgi:hypothetical protein
LGWQVTLDAAKAGVAVRHVVVNWPGGAGLVVDRVEAVP